ncbi:MAG TPA: hypothetical protein VJ599_05865 [Nitrososphaeraceae archaeon]|nr:hypothetical protein [Nitrososphaeraceae archaeon]
MSSYSRIQTGWILEALDGYDFSKIRRVCDVGEDKVTVIEIKDFKILIPSK